MLCYNGLVSLYCFFGHLRAILSLLLFNLTYNLIFQIWGFFYSFPILYYVFVNVIIRVIYKGYDYQVALRASFLGFVLALGVYVKLFSANHTQVFGVYMCVMAMFHYSEFLCMAYIQPNLVSVDSFVISHSLQYSVAAIASWCEFFIESYFFPDLKMLCWLSNIGLLMCVIGDSLRKASMLTAGSNFNHLVQCEKADDHILITHGVYSWFRHPSYVGWFYWSIGTQIILVNPICIIAYALASWFFFKERVIIEEIMLLNFLVSNIAIINKTLVLGYLSLKAIKFNRPLYNCFLSF